VKAGRGFLTVTQMYCLCAKKLEKRMQNAWAFVNRGNLGAWLQTNTKVVQTSTKKLASLNLKCVLICN
jgi:hypothetical protein